MTPIDWLEIVAASLTTGAFIPQTLKTLKTRSRDDIISTDVCWVCGWS